MSIEQSKLNQERTVEDWIKREPRPLVELGSVHQIVVIERDLRFHALLFEHFKGKERHFSTDGIPSFTTYDQAMAWAQGLTLESDKPKEHRVAILGHLLPNDAGADPADLSKMRSTGPIADILKQKGFTTIGLFGERGKTKDKPVVDVELGKSDDRIFNTELLDYVVRFGKLPPNIESEEAIKVTDTNSPLLTNEEERSFESNFNHNVTGDIGLIRAVTSTIDHFGLTDKRKELLINAFIQIRHLSARLTIAQLSLHMRENAIPLSSMDSFIHSVSEESLTSIEDPLLNTVMILLQQAKPLQETIHDPVSKILLQDIVDEYQQDVKKRNYETELFKLADLVEKGYDLFAYDLTTGVVEILRKNLINRIISSDETNRLFVLPEVDTIMRDIGTSLQEVGVRFNPSRAKRKLSES